MGRVTYFLPLALALVVQARYLVSRDRDLLDLMNDEAFRQQFPGLLILDPAAFLQAIVLRDEPEHASTEEAE